jgi:hypothetical protein
MTLPTHTHLFLQNSKTGEFLTDWTCEAMQPGAEWLACCRGTFRVSDGKHCLDPLVIIGVIQPWGRAREGRE